MISVDLEKIHEMLHQYEKPDFRRVSDYFAQKSIDNPDIAFLMNGKRDDREKEKKEKKQLCLITGGIAAGKSTVAYSLVNYFGLQKLPYISSDSFYKAFFQSQDFDDGYSRARELTDSLLKYYSEHEMSFVWETVLSKDKKKDFLKKLTEKDYSITCFYITVKQDEIMINRSNKRIKYGYHEVPNDFIKDRAAKSLKALEWIAKLSDKMIILDNSEKLSLAAYSDSNALYINKNRLSDDCRRCLVSVCSTNR